MWYMFFCMRCEKPYRTQAIDWHCNACRVDTVKAGLNSLATMGQVSGA